ncbi:tryptophan 2,3-dioxygenase [Flexivirga endophytica]|uniref:Tryptophan 2,3-dioxygenase n=1 Tax=Flexivirga endophytica TaxID=1849103 RepID=A0A916T4K5_9MICO|nr:tryptophan 2,3-dioxygenase family protein [Flexivirga endophytica]GGB31148.1 tryptophan 2,3-dioxygenase [Flexivirga endophytica]GHB52097.1 tryptophan 2,3-dioxygenase [Flexivirga endophytica]
MSIEDGQRAIEDGVRTDFRSRMDYGGYLDLDKLLDAQHPVSEPVHPDELLFIIQHQTTELWFKLVLHELTSVRTYLQHDEVSRARKALARVKHIFRTLAEQWSVLATLTPSEYAEFRSFLGSASGFQSHQYRSVEFILGNKNAGMLPVFAAKPEHQESLRQLLESPTVYDAFLRFLVAHGHQVPQQILDRDLTQAWVEQPELIPVFERIYADPDAHWAEYAMCEDLVDLEDAFQFWRFRHLRTVQRTIGYKKGTGGSSGVDFLKRALDLTFFPELYSVRTEIG